MAVKPLTIGTNSGAFLGLVGTFRLEAEMNSRSTIIEYLFPALLFYSHGMGHLHISKHGYKYTVYICFAIDTMLKMNSCPIAEVLMRALMYTHKQLN